MIRQQLIEQLTREIMNYDAEYRRETRQVEFGLTHGTEKEGRADWHLAISDPPPSLDRRGWSRAETQRRRVLRHLLFHRRSVPMYSDLIV